MCMIKKIVDDRCQVGIAESHRIALHFKEHHCYFAVLIKL